jgi:hypothetical protein
MWLELCSLVESVSLSDEEDELVWQHQSSGVYSSHSLYSIINFRGVLPVYIPVIWKIRIPPRVHFFFGCCLVIGC